MRSFGVVLAFSCQVIKVLFFFLILKIVDSITVFMFSFPLSLASVWDLREVGLEDAFGGLLVLRVLRFFLQASRRFRCWFHSSLQA